MTLDWVCLDIGETLIDETRVWSAWADVLGVPRFTFMGVLGGVVARGEDPGSAFAALGCPDWEEREAEVHAVYGGFVAEDLYPDALPAIAALRARGLRVAVIGNQPARRTRELRALGVDVDAMAMSDEIGAAKPQPAFFARALDVMGDPPPERVAYVGDRVDNDVLPSRAAGLQPVWLRRGPWGLLQADTGGDAALVLRSLTELVGVVRGR